jgi:hypothetical protein
MMRANYTEPIPRDCLSLPCSLSRGRLHHPPCVFPQGTLAPQRALSYRVFLSPPRHSQTRAVGHFLICLRAPGVSSTRHERPWPQPASPLPFLRVGVSPSEREPGSPSQDRPWDQ